MGFCLTRKKTINDRQTKLHGNERARTRAYTRENVIDLIDWID